MRQALGPGALGRPGGIGWRGRWEGGSGWGRHVNPRPFHFNVLQNSLQIKKKKKNATLSGCELLQWLKESELNSTAWQVKVNVGTGYSESKARETLMYVLFRSDPMMGLSKVTTRIPQKTPRVTNSTAN